MDVLCKQKIDTWIKSCGGNDLVLVIGAGFSRNAEMIGESSSKGANSIPIWNDVITRIRGEINMPNCDSLLAFDLYKNAFGLRAYEELMLSMLKDDDLRPGAPHKLLPRIPRLKAIITTNNIDTLLDKVFPEAKRIICDSDLSKISSSDFSIYYLHGHRSSPSSWINSYSDYDDINQKNQNLTANCRGLLATYPSLFLGFGHSDPDLHSILRFVNKTMGGHKPAMLSLSIENCSALEDYWKSIGLTIARVTDIDSSNSISAQIANSIKYIVKTRAELLKKSHRLSPGYRIGSSFMDSLRNNRQRCTEADGIVSLCPYHKSRSETMIRRIVHEEEIVSYTPYTSKIRFNGEITQLIQEMKAGEYPTGSWGLMPSHRKWLIDGIRLYSKESNLIRVLISGIGGLPHFVDIMSLLYSIPDHVNYHVTVIDLCKGPLFEIKQFILSGTFAHHSIDEQLYLDVRRHIIEEQTIVECLCEDLFSAREVFLSSFDIVLSHHLVSTWGCNNKARTEEYANVISGILKESGLLISAFNVSINENTIYEFQEIMKRNSLVAVDTKLSFDLYDYDITQPFSEDIIVDNETLLTIHRKHYE